MKTRPLVFLLFALIVTGPMLAGEVRAITAQQIAAQDLKSGPSQDVLPGIGAVVHLQIRDLFSGLEGLEQIVVAGVPEKVLPPDAQELLRTEHPLLTLVGLQILQQPLTPEAFEQQTGLDPRGTATLTLYLGDPRRMFMVSLPAGSREPLANLLTAALRPSLVEEILLGGQKALRVVSPRLKFVSELYVVASRDVLYLSGDRSLAIALYDAPDAQRLGQDPFMRRVLGEADEPQIRFVLNPASIKPLAMQLQALGGMAPQIIQQQRQRLLQDLPPEAREQFEMQVRAQLGVNSLEEFADYAECILIATIEQALDFVTGSTMAFEGLTLSAKLQDGVDQVSLKVYSQKFQDGNSTAAIPLAEVRQALAWLGPDCQSFSVTGRKPAPKDLPVLASWVKRVQTRLEAKGLDTALPGRLTRLLEERTPIPTVESRAPWTLTTYAPLRPLPSMEAAASLGDYLASLDLPVRRPVKIIAGKDTGFLEDCFRDETEALNRNRELTTAFVDSFGKQRRLLEHLNRFEAVSIEGDISKYVRESAWITAGGLFGYDQHELINRKVVWARQAGPYLVYHRGTAASLWLANLKKSQTPGVVPGVTQLLDRVPEGANCVSVSRVLVGLPALVDWLDELEARLHADARKYLEQAQAIIDDSSDLDSARQKIRQLRIPPLIGSVNLNPQTRRVYALLPSGNAGLTLPRARLIPVLQKLIADFESKADEVGGALIYTKVGAGSWEFTAAQNWDALTTLTRTVGNSLFEHYLATPERHQELQQLLTAPRDLDPSVFEEVIARNPDWLFIQQPKPKTEAKLDKPIPARSEDATVQMIDLTAFYNGALDQTWHKGGLPNNTLKDLPSGIREFGGVPFDVRGVVQLAGQQAARELSVKFPEQIAGIPVGQAAGRIHFLHACGWQSPKGTTVGWYLIHYANGTSREVPIVYGQDVQDWWMSESVDPDSRLKVVWQGTNHASPDGPPVGLFQTTWHNPMPEQEIRSVDYRSAMNNSAPFLVAITLE